MVEKETKNIMVEDIQEDVVKNSTIVKNEKNKATTFEDALSDYLKNENTKESVNETAGNVFVENSSIEYSERTVKSKKEKAHKSPLMPLPKIKKQVVSEDAKTTKKYAWLSYILFFIPLLINKNSEFVRLHANEGLEINLIDLTGILFLLLGTLIKTTSLVWSGILIFMTIVGIFLLVLTTISKVYMITSSLLGYSHQTPWFCKYRFIKPLKKDK